MAHHLSSLLEMIDSFGGGARIQNKVTPPGQRVGQQIPQISESRKITPTCEDQAESRGTEHKISRWIFQSTNNGLN